MVRLIGRSRSAMADPGAGVQSTWRPYSGSNHVCAAEATKLAAHPSVKGRAKMLNHKSIEPECGDWGDSIMVRLFQEDQGHPRLPTSKVYHQYCGVHGRCMMQRRSLFACASGMHCNRMGVVPVVTDVVTGEHCCQSPGWAGVVRLQSLAHEVQAFALH